MRTKFAREGAALSPYLILSALSSLEYSAQSKTEGGTLATYRRAVPTHSAAASCLRSPLAWTRVMPWTRQRWLLVPPRDGP